MTITDLSKEPQDIVNLPVSILNWFRKAMPTPTTALRFATELSRLARALSS